LLLEIRHITQYRYARFVRESVMEVWMQPQRSARQRLVSFDLEIDPPTQVFSYADSFGNAVYHFDVPHPHDRLTITARSAVETQAPTPLPDRLDQGEWDRLRSDFLRGECFDFLRPHGFARESEALHQFMAEHAIDGLRERDPLSALKTLNQTIYDGFGYEAGVTRADSPIDDVLKAKKGVCQDFAHVMIGACRSLGLAARYVSGYLLTQPPPGMPRLVGADASHAWVQVWCPVQGWLALDPTNAVPAGTDHVTLAWGRDYADVAPLRGVVRGGGQAVPRVSVTVTPLGDAPSDPPSAADGA
jgi:transglutaminase-like putative cysteine protease